MITREQRGQLINHVLGLGALGLITATSVLAPEALSTLDKALQKQLKKLDKKVRDQEIRATLRYMKQSGLVGGHYDHGLTITDKARERLERAEIDAIKILRPTTWDKKWRIIFYDIPEHKKTSRDILALKLRQLGCQQLQRSVWIHPFPCEEEIQTIAVRHSVASHITYIETDYINNESALKDRFSHLF